MKFNVLKIGNSSVLHIEAVATLLLCDKDLEFIIGEAWSLAPDLVVINISCFDPIVFDLSNGYFGAISQKFVNYRLAFAVVGDVDVYTSKSNALGAYVYESNQTNHSWFVSSLSALEARLAPQADLATGGTA